MLSRTVHGHALQIHDGTAGAVHNADPLVHRLGALVHNEGAEWALRGPD